MSTNSPFNRVPCPFCGGVFDLEQAWEDADGRRFIELMTSLPPAVIRPLYGYLKLFKPEKQSLRWSRVLRLAQELAPLIKNAQVTRNGIVYTVPVPQWGKALLALVNNRPDTVTLPLKNNAYLLSMLANQAEKAAAKQEDAIEQQRRHRGRSGADQGLQAAGQYVAPKPKPKKTGPPANWRPESLPARPKADD